MGAGGGRWGQVGQGCVGEGAGLEAGTWRRWGVRSSYLVQVELETELFGDSSVGRVWGWGRAVKGGGAGGVRGRAI